MQIRLIPVYQGYKYQNLVRWLNLFSCDNNIYITFVSNNSNVTNQYCTQNGLNHITVIWSATESEVINFLVLNSTEHEINHAHKC